MMTCTNCKARKVERIAFPYRCDLDGRRFSTELPATRCRACGEVLVSGPGGLQADKAISRELVRSGVLGPQGFRWLRGAARLEARHLAALLNVSPGTVSRWENGKREIDRGAVALVCALALQAMGEPVEARALLESLAANNRPPRRVKLDLRKTG